MDTQPNDLFNEGNVIRSNIKQWKEIGDFVAGVYVDRQIRIGSKIDPNKISAVYTLMQDDGTPILVYGRMKIKLRQDGEEKIVAVIAGLENAKLGQYVGVKYMGDKPTEKGNPIKLITAFSKGDLHPEVLAKYQASQSGMPMNEGDEDEPDFSK